MHIKKIGFIFLFFFLCEKLSFSDTFQCERVFPKDLQVEQIASCNSSYAMGTKRNQDNELLQRIIKNNNLGGITINFPHNGKKIVYRSAYLAASPMCIAELSKSGVTTVVNLYSGKLAYAPQMLPLEQAIFKRNGTKKYIQIDGFMVNSSTALAELNAKMVTIMKLIEKAKGNVLIHCDSGEHDTGVVFAVLNKCFNRQLLKPLEENAACHMDSTTQYGRRTYKRLQEIVKQFPCELLEVR